MFLARKKPRTLTRRIIALYLSRLFVARMLGGLFGLVSILQLLDLLDQASTILTDAGSGGIGRYLAWRLPILLTEMLPVAVLLGALLTFSRLAGSLEMTAIRSAGINVWQMIGRLLPAILLVSVANLVLQADVTPRCERGFADWWAVITQHAADAPAPARLWLRAHGDVAAIDRVSLDGRHLEGLLIVQRSPSGDLATRLDATDAAFQDGRWVLHGVRLTLPGRTDARPLPHAPWAHGPSPANLIELARPVDTQTVGRLVAILRGQWVGGRGPDYYRTQLQALAAGVLSPLLMVLLAAPVLLNTPRSGAGLLPLATALALGLLYLTVAGLLTALGGAGVLPPVIAGWSALLIFGAYGALRVWQAEEG